MGAIRVFGLLILGLMTIGSFAVAGMIEVGDSMFGRPDRPDKPEHSKPVVVVTPGVVDAARPYRVGDDTYVTLDLFLGPLSGVRAGFPEIGMGGGTHLAVEGIYGGGVTTVGFVQMVGGGMRVHINVKQDKEAKNALFVSPGVDFLVMATDRYDSRYSFNSPLGNVYFLTANADVAYVHEYSKHFGVAVGMHVGAGVSLGGYDANYEQTSGTWTPELSLFAGLRF